MRSPALLALVVVLAAATVLFAHSSAGNTGGVSPSPTRSLSATPAASSAPAPAVQPTRPPAAEPKAAPNSGTGLRPQARKGGGPDPDSKVAGSAVLVRSVGGLDPAVAERLADLDLRASVEVRAGAVLLRSSRHAQGRVVDAPPAGWGIPLDAVAVNPGEYASVLPESQQEGFSRLRPGTVLLGETSSRLRGIGRGATIDVEGESFDVAAVVDDRLIGAAELVMTVGDGARIGVTGVRYVLVQADEGSRGLRAAVSERLEGVPRLLVTDLGSAPWPRSWREVLPQALVKDRFGEFAVRPGSGRSISQEAGWVQRHIATATVPVLGEVRCHRAVLRALTRALAELERRGLAHLVDPGDYAGCFSPRLIAAGASVSRHAWGLAVDLNASRNQFGADSTQDPRLVRIMERHGFGFGGRWPVPDPMHFEYRGGGP